MPQFEVSTYPSQIFWLVICFCFLCGVMALHLVPRLKSVLEAREKRLQEDRKRSEEIRDTVASLKQENGVHLAEAQKKAHAVLHGVVQEIHRQKSERLAVLDEELSRKIKDVRHHLETQTRHILEDKEAIVAEVIKAASSRLLGQNLPQKSVQPAIRAVLEKQGKS